MHTRDKPLGPTCFIFRDPRDVFLSMWHWRGGRFSIDQIVKLCDTDSRYKRFIHTWWNTGKAEAQTSYEELITEPILALERVTNTLTGQTFSRAEISAAIHRQEFTKVKAAHPELAHHMWTGKIGIWRNHYSRSDAELVQNLFGGLMMEQGYITGPEWVRECKQQ